MEPTLTLAVLDDYNYAAEQYADFSSLEPKVRTTAFHDHLSDEDELVKRLYPFSIVAAMRERTPFPRSLLCQLPNLKLLITTGSGNASIDANACHRLGIRYASTGPGTGSQSTCELAWALTLAMSKRMTTEATNVKNGGWQSEQGRLLGHCTLGLLGFGRIGTMMVPVAKALGMKVLAWSEHLSVEDAEAGGAEKAVSLVDLMSRSDFVSIHQRLSDRSRGLVGTRELAALGPNSYLINTSRGPIVQEDALVAALRSGVIAGAGLDVFDTEPLPPQHPLRTLENVIALPHVGYGTVENYKSWFSDILEQVKVYSETGAVLREIM